MNMTFSDEDVLEIEVLQLFSNSLQAQKHKR